MRWKFLNVLVTKLTPLEAQTALADRMNNVTSYVHGMFIKLELNG